MPPYPTPHLVVIQTHLFITLFQQFLDPVPAPMDTSQGPSFCLPFIGQRVPRLRLGLQAAEHRQPLPWPGTTILVLGLHRRQ
jgi:hypothetical protein